MIRICIQLWSVMTKRSKNRFYEQINQIQESESSIRTLIVEQEKEYIS